MTYWLEWDRQWSDSSDTLDRAYELALQAVQLCPQAAETRRRLGWIALYRNSAHVDRYIAGLQRAGFPACPSK